MRGIRGPKESQRWKGVKLPRHPSVVASEAEFLLAAHVEYASRAKDASDRTKAREMAKLARLALESYHKAKGAVAPKSFRRR